MSFILDALRKSEAERQQQNAPGIASIPQGGSTRSGPRWMWLAVGLLLVNLVVLSGVLLKMNDSETVAQTPAAQGDSPDAAENSTQVATALDTTEPAPPDDAIPVVAAPTMRSLAVPASSDSPASVPASADSADDATITAIAMESGIQAPAVENDSGIVSSFNELRASGVLNLPDLHLDIHVYSGQPDERFVFVNMAKYRENATLSEGPVVQEITPEGVILDYRGTDFLLPRE